jgi:hypothetical protein
MAIATRPKPSVHHKKRVGKHHKTTKHYMKAYWPYIPITAIVGLGIVVNALLGGSGNVLGAQSDLSAYSLLVNTNQQRAAQDELPLHPNQQLSAAAQAKATDMVTRNYWSHDTPDGKQPWVFVTSAGYTYQTAGENLAYGFTDAASIINGWMNSKEHRDNILNASYQDVGFGIASSENYNGKGPETVVVAMYAQPVSNAVSNISFRVKQTHPASNVLGATVDTGTKPVSRIQLLTEGSAPWSMVASLVILTAATTLFIVRHGRKWHAVVVRSESFVIHHPWFDILLVTVGTTAFIASRVTGFIN